MPDNVDFIQEQQAELLERQINAARVKHCGVSALVCEECDAPIPSFQFILHEKKRAESGKNAGQEWLAVVGYYPKLSQLVSGLMHHDILTGSAKSFADLNTQVEQLSKRCSEAFSRGASE